jgi:hypothetical protein
MGCDECHLLLQEYNEETRRLERAVTDYRLAVTSGIVGEIEASRTALSEVRAGVDAARHAFQGHKLNHEVDCVRPASRSRVL